MTRDRAARTPPTTNRLLLCALALCIVLLISGILLGHVIPASARGMLATITAVCVVALSFVLFFTGRFMRRRKRPLPKRRQPHDP